MRSKGSAVQLEANRKRAIDLLKQKWHPKDVASAMGVTLVTVYRWRKRFNEGGKKALDAVPQYVHQCRLRDSQQEELGKIILEGALAHGYPTDLWTTSRLADVVHKQFGIEYHNDHLGRLLHQLGYSCQKPMRQAKERDETSAKNWKKRVWPRVKKGPRTQS